MAKRSTAHYFRLGAAIQSLVAFGILLLFIVIAWWMIGGLLSITLGDILIYGIMFCVGYAVGASKNE